MSYNIKEIARIAHEANRAYCEAMGDLSQVPWDEAPSWQRDSAIAGVRAIAADPDRPPSASHASWFAHKEADGWIYGPHKDAEKKTHPCMVAYEDLPPEQQAKDYIFLGIVKAMLEES